MSVAIVTAVSRSPIVWMNGALIPADQVRVSPFDLGWSVGWAAFETMPGYDGRIFGFLRHFERLKHSAGVMGIYVPAPEIIQTAVSQVLDVNGLGSGRSRIRLSLSSGDHSLIGSDETKEVQGSVMVTAVNVVEQKNQVVLQASPFSHNERSGLSGCKTSSYGDNLVALRQAHKAGADEAIMVNTVGQLCECATANIFLVSNGKLMTPSLDTGCLAGVTRSIIIELAREDGLTVEEGEFGMIDVSDADEIFLTSSMRGVQSAVMMRTGSEVVGAVTNRLSELYHKRVREELGL